MARKSIAVNHGKQLIVDQGMAMIPFAYLSGGASNAIVHPRSKISLVFVYYWLIHGLQLLFLFSFV